MKLDFSWQILMKLDFSWQILMKLDFSWQIFKKYLNIKFHENLSSGSLVVLCGWTDVQAGRLKLIIAFHNFANKPKNYTYVSFPLTQSFDAE